MYFFLELWKEFYALVLQSNIHSEYMMSGLDLTLETEMFLSYMKNPNQDTSPNLLCSRVFWECLDLTVRKEKRTQSLQQWKVQSYQFRLIVKIDQYIKTRLIFYALRKKGDFVKADRLLHVALQQAQVSGNGEAVTHIYTLMANLAMERKLFNQAEKLFTTVLKRLFRWFNFYCQFNHCDHYLFQ